MDRIDSSALTAFLSSLREHSYTELTPSGSVNRFDSTTVSFDSSGRFLCYTTVEDGVLYSFYSDLELYRDSSEGVAVATDASDFDLINGRLKTEQHILAFGPSFD